MPKVMPVTGMLALALAATTAASAQVPSNRDSVNIPWPNARNPVTTTTAADTAFIRQAIRGNYTEVALGRLADSRAENDDVKEFGERMVTDHNAMNQKWGELAGDNRMSVRPDFGEAGEQTIERLDDLEDEEFDQAYMTEMIRHHEQDLATFQRVASSARSPEVRQLAASGASTIREHLALARHVGTQVGVSTTAARAGGVTAVPTPIPSDTDRTRRTTAGGVTSDDRDDRDDRDDGTSMRREDRAFVEGVLSDHLMHVGLAKRAQRDAKNDETRRLAARIERDLTRWTKRWENFADRRSANVSFRLQQHNREKLDRLEKASERKNFDRVYAEIVADHLEMMVDDFRSERREKQPAAVGRLATEELPLLRELQASARRLER